MEAPVSPLISVALPVYKAERYIERCLRSIGSQTMKDVEYIFVDDASPDQSTSAIEDYFKDSPLNGSVFRIISNDTNSGVGYARQKGLDHAQGKYVIQVDPDDWLEPDYLEKLYLAAEAAGADITFCDIFIEYPDRQVLSRQCPALSDPDSVISQLCHGGILGSCWNKLVRRSAIGKTGAHFIPGVNVCEDILFFLQMLRHNPVVASVHEPLYHYDRFTNNNSIQRHMLPDHLAQDNRLIEAVSDILGDDRYTIPRGDFISSAIFHIFEISGYSSAEFRRRYSFARPYISANASFSRPKKAILTMACSGLYRPARRLYAILKSIK